jgi:hypothetical protein
MRLENLRADINRWGWTRSLFIRVMSILRRTIGFRIFRIGVRPLARLSHKQVCPGGIVLRVLQPDELLAASSDPALDLPADFVRRALARGDMAFGAYEGDLLVGYSWRTFTAAPHADGVWAKVERPYFCGYDAFTRKSHRGRRIHAAVALFSDAYLLERGYSAEVGFVDIANFASLNVAKRMGRFRIGYAGHLKWLGHFITFRTPAVKAIGAQLFEPGREIEAGAQAAPSVGPDPEPGSSAGPSLASVSQRRHGARHLS